MFGNPGTVEQGFLDALGEYPDMRYITTLQETIAVAMADGYARATQKPTRRPAAQRRRARQRDRDDVPGEARRRAARRDRRRVGRPLRLDGRADGRRPRLDGEAGDQVVDARHRPVLDAARAAAGDQDRRDAADAGPSSSRCRWTCSTRSSRRRSCRRSFPDTRVAPTAEADRARGRAARRRVAADRRSSATASRCSGAQAELTRVAELLGAEVWGANFSEVNIDAEHPLFRGPARAHVRRPQPKAITSQADAVLIVRHVRLPRGLPGARGRLRARRARSCTSTSTPTRSRRTSRSTSASSPTRSSRSACSPTSSSGRSRPSSARRRPSGARASSASRSARSSTRAAARDREFDGDTPMHPSTFMAELAQQAPDDVVDLRRGADRRRPS